MRDPLLCLNINHFRQKEIAFIGPLGNTPFIKIALPNKHLVSMRLLYIYPQNTSDEEIMHI